MNIVVDTNIFISALIKEGMTRSVILTSGFNFLFPEFEFEEIFNHKLEILDKSGLNEEEFNVLLLGLLRKVKIIRTEKVVGYHSKAKKIIGHIDKDDVMFIATALAFGCGIWSDDKHFKMQKKVGVYTTKEMWRSV